MVICGFSEVCFRHLEAWTQRIDVLMEAVVKQARTTSHFCLVACDVNVDPVNSQKGLWFKEECMIVEAQEVASRVAPQARK